MVEYVRNGEGRRGDERQRGRCRCRGDEDRGGVEPEMGGGGGRWAPGGEAWGSDGGIQRARERAE